MKQNINSLEDKRGRFKKLQHQSRHFHRLLNKFAVLSVPKVGSSNIREWSRLAELEAGTGGDNNFLGEVYSFWREPAERILSGLATDMNWLAYARGGLPKTFTWDYKSYQGLYLDTIRQWCLSPALSPLRLGELVCPFSHHEMYEAYIGFHRVDHFISLGQIALFPGYLNKKYGLGLGDIGCGPDMNQLGWLPTDVFRDILMQYPQAHDLVLSHIARDTFRPTLLDLSIN